MSDPRTACTECDAGRHQPHADHCSFAEPRTPTGRDGFSAPAAQYLRQMRGAEKTVREIRDAALAAGATVHGDEIIVISDYTELERRLASFLERGT